MVLSCGDEQAVLHISCGRHHTASTQGDDVLETPHRVMQPCARHMHMSRWLRALTVQRLPDSTEQPHSAGHFDLFPRLRELYVLPASLTAHTDKCRLQWQAQTHCKSSPPASAPRGLGPALRMLKALMSRQEKALADMAWASCLGLRKPDSVH